MDFELLLIIDFFLDVETIDTFAERTAADPACVALAVVLDTTGLVTGASAGVEDEIFLSNCFEFGLESKRIDLLQFVDDLLSNAEERLVIEAVEALAVGAAERALLEALTVELETLGLFARTGELLLVLFVDFLLGRKELGQGVLPLLLLVGIAQELFVERDGFADEKNLVFLLTPVEELFEVVLDLVCLGVRLAEQKYFVF